jgi:ABC-type polysaccharide/polyol phosphate export permease
MLGISRARIAKAGDDLGRSVLNWRIWHLLAWQDVRHRYRRSTLGPLWLTLSMGVQIVTIGVITSFLFGQSIDRSLPFVCLGFIFWSLITSIVNDGAMSFLSANSWIMQIKMPLVTHVIQKIWANIIIMGHNLLIFVVVATVYGIYNPTAILFLITFPLVIICLAWLPIVLAVASTRFRDLPAMVTNVFNLAFWLTPVVYMPAQLGGNRWISDINPIAHMLDVLREPLLGNLPSRNSIAVVTATGVIGWIITFPFFARFRERVSYWL